MAHLYGDSVMATLTAFGQGVLDILFPPHCPQCGGDIAQSGALCSHCWSDIRFISEPYCACCGLPLEFDPGLGFDALCGACNQSVPAFDQARAVFIYDHASRNLILKFKHADRLDLLPGFETWMLRIGRRLIDEADYIVPVPLHWSRRLTRRYNQAAELARSLSRHGTATYVPDMLVRKRRTLSQGRQSRQQRWSNVRGAFAPSPNWARKLEGTRVLLIDDVLTTGATAEACANTLKRAGCRHVDLLTLARVPGPED